MFRKVSFVSALFMVVSSACSLSPQPEPETLVQEQGPAIAIEEDIEQQALAIAQTEPTSDAACSVGTPGSENYCTSACPCESGEGDCDTSSQCAPGLRCSFNVGGDYGYQVDVDVCTCPSADLAGTGTFCSERCPCDVGGGDCDTNAECAPGLTCYRDVGAQYGYTADLDVCASCLTDASNGTIDFCSSACLCEQGQGNCDSDSECATGTRCFLDVGADFGLAATTNVCSAFSPPSRNGKHDHCTAAYPCSEGGGDCDSNSECATGLTCFQDVGADYGFTADTDVCAACPPASRLGSSDFCSPGCPCVHGEGDCDTNADCATGLICAPDAGAQFGLDPSLDVCVTPNSN